MRRLLSFTLLLLLLILANPQALACSCLAPPPPKKAMEGAVAVFSGKCIDVVTKNGTRTCTFEVDRVWKGEIGPKVVVTTADNDGLCGYGFDTKGDATYLVYCYGKNDALGTNICTRTAPLANAKEDLKELGDGAKPKEVKKDDKKKE